MKGCRGGKWRKGNHTKVNETQGFSDNLQPVKVILFMKFSNFLPFILGGPIIYYPRERKEGTSRAENGEKGIIQK